MEQKEIGGYFGYEKYNGRMLYENGIKLNTARNCLAHLIVTKNIKEIYLPYYCCRVVTDTCMKYSVKVKYYKIGYDFKPIIEKPINKESQWIYIVNFYGQLSNKYLMGIAKHNNIIVDNIEAYFQRPIKGIDTLYSCRKYFGVTDGAILFSDKKDISGYPIDSSRDRTHYLIGRFEDCANNFHQEFINLTLFYRNENIKVMSKFTENLLHSFDYRKIKRTRTINFSFLHNKLKHLNKLNIKKVKGAFMYPLMIDNADIIRQELIKQKIYIPILWKENNLDQKKNKIEWELTYSTLLLPCDQRYNKNDMQTIIDNIIKNINK